MAGSRVKLRLPAEELTRRVAILALLLVSAPGSAQKPEPSPAPLPHIRSEVNEVLVPVVVMDRHGHHIPGLKASDFKVFEDGKPQRIVAFSIESMAPVSIGLAKTPVSPDAPRRTYLIVVDTLHSSFASFGRVRDALGKFFEKEKSADAQYAVMALGREVKVVQDSARDPSAVLAAVRAKAFSRTIQDSEATNLGAAADQFTALMRNYCSLCMCGSAGNEGEQPECSAAKSRVQAFLMSFGERTFLLDQQFLGQLTEIVKAIASMPTSRTIIFISDGFSRFAGRELYGIIRGFDPKDRSLQFNPRDTQPELESVLKIATRNDVRFYTIDSRGLYAVASMPGSGFDASSSSSTNTQMDSRTSPNVAAGVPEAAVSQSRSAARESTDALAQLAHETGGLFFENSNDLMKGIRAAVADGREYYVLAYVPEDKAMDGTYRKILVTVRDAKWQVNAKAGYWAASN